MRREHVCLHAASFSIYPSVILVPNGTWILQNNLSPRRRHYYYHPEHLSFSWRENRSWSEAIQTRLLWLLPITSSSSFSSSHPLQRSLLSPIQSRWSRPLDLVDGLRVLITLTRQEERERERGLGLWKKLAKFALNKMQKRTRGSTGRKKEYE